MRLHRGFFVLFGIRESGNPGNLESRSLEFRIPDSAVSGFRDSQIPGFQMNYNLLLFPKQADCSALYFLFKHQLKHRKFFIA